MRRIPARTLRRSLVAAVVLIAGGLAIAPLPRARADAPVCRYSLEGTGVLDAKTGLIWRRDIALGGLLPTWSGAKTICGTLATLDGVPWRAPTIAELQTLIDDRESFPIIDGCAFPSTPNVFFWSSTPLASAPNQYAWAMSMADGTVEAHPTLLSLNHTIRCVR